jgi:hypothetical protein
MKGIAGQARNDEEKQKTIYIYINTLYINTLYINTTKMKRTLATAILLLITGTACAQVGINTTTPISMLEVNGSATNEISTSGTSAVDFTKSNLAQSDASDDGGAPGNIEISGMKDGGTYTLACTRTTVSTGIGIPTLSLATGANNGITEIKYGDRTPITKTDMQQVVFSIVCIGNTAYVYTTLFNP